MVVNADRKSAGVEEVWGCQPKKKAKLSRPRRFCKYDGGQNDHPKGMPRENQRDMGGPWVWLHHIN